MTRKHPNFSGGEAKRLFAPDVPSNRILSLTEEVSLDIIEGDLGDDLLHPNYVPDLPVDPNLVFRHTFDTTERPQ